MKSLVLQSMVFILISFFVTINALAEDGLDISTVINYQGYLTDNSGKALTGTYQITFLLYGKSEGGESLWSETHTVDAENGLFNVLLGGVDSTLSHDLFDGERYLAMKVGTEAELSPRMRMTSVAYSLRAEQAEGAFTLDAPDDGPEDIVYIDNTGNVGIGTTSPSAELDVSGEVVADNLMVKIFDDTCEGVNSFVIPDLDGDLHKIYRIYFYGKIHTAETYLVIRPNGDDTITNYRSWLNHFGDASGTNGGTYGMFLCRSWVGECDATAEFTLFSVKDRQRMGHGQAMMWYTGDYRSLVMTTGGRWNGPANANITSLKFALTNSSGQSTGTFSGRFIVYALEAK